MNKLGFYAQVTTGIPGLVEAIRDVKPPTLLTHANDRGLLQAIRRDLSPDTFIVGRLHLDVEIASEGDTFKVGASTPLFEIQPPLVGGAYFSAEGDGQRILVVPTEEQQADTLLNVFLGWPTVLEGRR